MMWNEDGDMLMFLRKQRKGHLKEISDLRRQLEEANSRASELAALLSAGEALREQYKLQFALQAARIVAMENIIIRYARHTPNLCAASLTETAGCACGLRDAQRELDKKLADLDTEKEEP